MRLLIITQKIDAEDENLGSFHQWVAAFAPYCSGVAVIASSAGSRHLPENVRIYSLGKERGASRLKRMWRYGRLMAQNYRKCDAVFFHMAPEFVLAAAPFLLFSRSPSALWYVHKSVTWRLRVAEFLVDYVFTASALSFRLPSKKVIYTGHAIDTKKFRPADKGRLPPEKIGLLSVGRISPVKNIEDIIRAAAILKNKWNRQWTLSLAGGPLVRRDEQYLAGLKELVCQNGLEDDVVFCGPRAHTQTPALYRDSDIFISLSATGSLDKSVLEAMSCGLPVICANEAFRPILPPRYFLEDRSPEALAERIILLAGEKIPRGELRELVTAHHSMSKTIKTIVHAFTPHL